MNNKTLKEEGQVRKQVKILGVKVDIGLTQKDVIDIIESDFLKDGNSHYICTTPPEFILDAQEDKEFRDIINNSDLSVVDGVGVLFAEKFLHNATKYKKGTFLYPLQLFLSGLAVGFSGIFSADTTKYRVDGVSLTKKICEISAQKSYSVFLLGGWPKDALGRKMNLDYDMAQTAEARLRELMPNINIIGATSRFQRDTFDDKATVDYIRECMKLHNIEKLDFLLVAYNHKYQEKWILRNAKNIPVAVSIGVGATIDYLAHYKKESPSFMHKIGLSWVYRLLAEPWKYKRILKAFPKFPLKVFFGAL